LDVFIDCLTIVFRKSIASLMMRLSLTAKRLKFIKVKTPNPED
jgi:hypothetical protein